MSNSLNQCAALHTTGVACALREGHEGAHTGSLAWSDTTLPKSYPLREKLCTCGCSMYRHAVVTPGSNDGHCVDCECPAYEFWQAKPHWDRQYNVGSGR